MNHTLEWHEMRRQGIGGSDVADVLSLEPYGCALKLWREKRGENAEIPKDNPHMLRGKYLEPIIIQLYREKTGRETESWNGERNESLPTWLIGNPDNVCFASPHEKGRPTPGVLECKCPARNTFQNVKKNGLPESWILQMQHYMAVTGFKWASIAVLWAEGWEFITFDVERDASLIKMVMEKEEAFWRLVENGPAPAQLDNNDARCLKCEYRISCWGAEEISVQTPNTIDLSGVQKFELALAKWREGNEIKKSADEIIDDAKNEILELIGNNESAIGVGGKIKRWTASRTSIDQKQLTADYPQIAEKYTKKTAYETIRIF